MNFISGLAFMSPHVGCVFLFEVSQFMSVTNASRLVAKDQSLGESLEKKP